MERAGGRELAAVAVAADGIVLIRAVLFALVTGFLIFGVTGWMYLQIGFDLANDDNPMYIAPEWGQLLRMIGAAFLVAALALRIGARRVLASRRRHSRGCVGTRGADSVRREELGRRLEDARLLGLAAAPLVLAMFETVGPAGLKERLGHVPTGRFATPAEIAGIAAFLASDDAGYLTATDIQADGGIRGAYTIPD